MANKTVKAVVLARGLGTRMRQDAAGAALDPDQARAADAGIKAMIPVGRAFLDYVLSALADAGYRQVCLVIGPEHEAIRRYYTETCRPRRVTVQFAIQERPLGTADAVAAAEVFAAEDLFLVINSDNYYPAEVCRALRELEGPGLAAFECESLVGDSNIPDERVRQYAILEIDGDGYLQRIIEKPDQASFASMGPEIFVSMNCWLFGPAIFRACRNIRPSPRGELELADAVQVAVSSLGERFKALKLRAGVLDLSRRSDVAEVARRLRDVEVRL
jgi:glucose-1-phosphate thymidylyltransferase